MMLAWRIAAREVRGGLAGFRVFLVCLILGVGAIAAVGLVRDAIRGGLADQGAVLLGGDAQYEFTYRRAAPEERTWIAAHAARVSEVVDFRSMVGTDAGDYALTQVKGVDGAYPLIGSLDLDPPVPVSALDQGGVPGVFLDPVLADRLGVKPGDSVLIGGRSFVMRARIVREPDASTGGISMGPRSIVSLSALEAAGMLDAGALFESNYRIVLPAGQSLGTLKAAAMKRFEGAGMRWADARRAAPGAERFTNQLASFLVLVGLAGLAVGGVGISNATNAWIGRKAGTIATLRALGATSGTIRWVFLLQIGMIAALGIIAGLAVASAAVLAGAGPITRLMPIPVDVRITAMPLVQAAVYGALTVAIFTLWPLGRMSELRAATLYRATGRARRWPSWQVVVLSVGLVTTLIGYAAFLSGMPGVAAGTLVSILVALAVLAVVAVGLRWLAGRWQRRLRGHPVLHAALAGISGPRSEVVAVVLSLGLGLTVLAAIGQIDAGMRRAISDDLPKQAPAYFIIDIQPDQLGPMRTALTAMPGVTRIDTAPMLRGVITKINDRPARAVGGDHWVLRGDRGVTFADAPREPLTAGTWWPKDYAGPPQVSVGAKEAQEIGLKLGDRLTVNILGRDIVATITSFRRVDFSTGGIGFVLVFNPQALAGAPYTDIATVYAASQYEAPILRDLARAFPTVTAIRVSEAIARASEALSVIGRAVALAASVTLLTGLVVLVGTAASGAMARARESALLRSLGATRRMVLAVFAVRSILTGAAAGTIAAGFGTAFAWAVTRFVMDMTYRFSPMPAVMVIVGGIVVTLLAGLVFALRSTMVAPASLLRAPE